MRDIAGDVDLLGLKQEVYTPFYYIPTKHTP